MIAGGAPPQDAAKYDGDQKCPSRRYMRRWPGIPAEACGGKRL